MITAGHEQGDIIIYSDGTPIISLESEDAVELAQAILDVAGKIDSHIDPAEE